MAKTPLHKRQALVGAGVTLVGVLMAANAATLPSEAGYAGVGPNFLPWVVSIALAVLGLLMVREALTGGFQDIEDNGPAASPFVRGFFWMSAGLLINAALITQVGFIVACAICFAFAAQALRQSLAPESSASKGLALVRRLMMDFVIGLAISAPVYWMFTKLLAIKLPGLTNTGWI